MNPVTSVITLMMKPISPNGPHFVIAVYMSADDHCEDAGENGDDDCREQEYPDLSLHDESILLRSV